MRRFGTHSRPVASLLGIVMIAAIACAPSPSYPSASITVNPCETQANIACDFLFGHIATSPGTSPRNRLVVFLNGSGATPQGYLKINSTLAQTGFHVVNLRYPSNASTTGSCPAPVADANPECFRAFKGELVVGANVMDPNGVSVDSSSIDVSKLNSVTNRLLQLVNYLATHQPTSGWGEYLQQSGGVCTHTDPTYGVCDLDWSKVVLMGHSLGGGVALYLAKLHQVGRVAILSGPADVSHDTSGAPVAAPWITEPAFATPDSAIYELSHSDEPGILDEQAGLVQLGLAPTVTSVDTQSAPYGGSHLLTTSLTPGCTLGSSSPHNSTAQDVCTPGTTPTLAPAWRFLAGA